MLTLRRCVLQYGDFQNISYLASQIQQPQYDDFQPIHNFTTVQFFVLVHAAALIALIALFLCKVSRSGIAIQCCDWLCFLGSAIVYEPNNAHFYIAELF